MRTTEGYTLLNGSRRLSVVGTSYHQDRLYDAASSTTGDLVRFRTAALLVTEDTNPHDANAIAVYIGKHVGYLSAANAGLYRSGLLALQEHYGTYIALHAMLSSNRHQYIGVYLYHNPVEFRTTGATVKRYHYRVGGQRSECSNPGICTHD